VSDHYRYRKDKTHLSSTFKLAIDNGHQNDYYYLKVYIWNNEEGMYANVLPRGDPQWDSGKYQACCLLMPYEEDIDTGEKFYPKFQAEIHLVLNEFGVEVVAHELTHWLTGWMQQQETDLDKGDDVEAICRVNGEMNKKFWNAFYRRYKVSEGKSELCQRN